MDNIIKKTLNLQDEIEIDLVIPPPHISSDYTLEIFKLAKKLKEQPNVLAAKIVEYINGNELNYFKQATLAGNFINLEVNREKIYKDALRIISDFGDKYGESDVSAKKIVLIDYSAPNIAKPIGVGHLRSTIIGQVLANIYRETGYSVIKDNHIGDWGTQFGSLIYAYQKWGDEKKVAKNPIRELKNLYVQFHEYSKENPEAKEKARELFARLENKDPELIALWKRFKDLSLKDFERIYKQLGIQFDTNIGESYFADQTDRIIEDCLSKGLCRQEKNSKIVIVDQIETIPSFLLRKQDGSSLYITRDMATLRFRINFFHPDTILYVVGREQELNFKQLFELGKRSGYLPKNVEVAHICFGMVLQNKKKMSTRRGTLIELDELIAQSVQKSKKTLLQKNPEINERNLKKIAEILGVGAILYNNLQQSRIKDISFNWDKMLSIEGGSAVYLQYTYARINSIIKKLNGVRDEADILNSANGDIFFENQIEFDIVRKLMMFPDVILKVQKTNSPHHLCVYLRVS
jgi:arginyl-tRNA synthetase